MGLKYPLPNYHSFLITTLESHVEEEVFKDCMKKENGLVIGPKINSSDLFARSIGPGYTLQALGERLMLNWVNITQIPYCSFTM